MPDYEANECPENFWPRWPSDRSPCTPAAKGRPLHQASDFLVVEAVRTIVLALAGETTKQRPMRDTDQFSQVGKATIGRWRRKSRGAAELFAEGGLGRTRV